VAARPRRLSVTQVELWRRDPYAIYARHVLKLRALDPLDVDPAAADLGTALHAALAAFLKGLEDRPMPADGFARLMREADDALKPLLARPAVWAFWRPRFERIARWFVATEAQRRADRILPVALECAGTMEFAAPAGPFTLSGTADRIDRHADGTLVVVDYKTGAVPGREDIALGYAPQLTLEAAMAEAGAFPGVAGTVAVLEYWRLAGRPSSGGGEIMPVTKLDIPTLIAEARDGLAARIAHYDEPGTRYPAAPKPARAPRFNDYVQLARTQEWMGGR
jgi:ATP-dependent helicase/nuclease subunit B